jgi:transposase
MRGKAKSQPELVCLMSPEMAVPKNHPIRSIKRFVDEVLGDLSPLFDDLYSDIGRPSIPPERLLKCKLLCALFTVRSERLLVEQIGYNLLYRWFLDMDLDEEVFDASALSKNQERLLTHQVARIFFGCVVDRAAAEGWVSNEHFSVDGTLIDAWASMKRFRPKDEKPPADDPGPSNRWVDFHGEKRGNDTHQSHTDPEARLLRKGKGREAKLCFGAHALMENRNGLCVDLRVTSATETTESRAATDMLTDQRELQGRDPKSVGADKGYHNKGFVEDCREAGIKPHVATVKDRRTHGLDGRTLTSKGYETSQRIRKRIEEIFGWMKTTGGFRKTRYRGIERTQQCGLFTAAAYNLVRMARLGAGPPPAAAPA